jgi:pimeloyl-ACP methyl ester carboxylesterase
MQNNDEPRFVDVARSDGDGPPWRLAMRRRGPTAEGAGAPGVVWLGGFASDMRGSKASAIDAWAQKKGCAYLRFDYSGHGESEGRFADGAISDWLEQSAAMLETQTQGPQILVGSSMGAWIALLLARRLAQTSRSARLHGLVLIAPAADFTQTLMWSAMTEAAQRAVMEEGVWLRPSHYGEPTPITRRLIEDGRRHLMLGGLIRTHAPVHILQGVDDLDVSWRHALALVERLSADPVTFSLIPGGDHSLSRDEDIARLLAALEAIS